MENRNHILITGTTSGIGQGVMQAYEAKGWRVTAVNRRRVQELEQRHPGVRFVQCDVRDAQGVRWLLDDMAETGDMPSVYFLSAGVNQVDHAEGFDDRSFREVMDINFMGVVNFLSPALRHAAGRPTTFVCASSTSNIFPNPKCISYHLSKVILHRMFRFMDRQYRSQGIRFKSMILGPIKTGIFASGKLASKLQSMARDWIVVDMQQSVGPLTRFVESRSQVLYYPKIALFFFIAAAIASRILPGMYKGAAQPARNPQEDAKASTPSG